MKNKSVNPFVRELSDRLHREPVDVERLLSALAHELRVHCSNLDGVAIPGFGSFQGVKHPEKIVSDLATGGRLLLPPEVVVDFMPGTKLRNIVRKQADE